MLEAEKHLEVAKTNTQQSMNCNAVIESYFDGKMAQQDINSQIVKMPISLAEINNQGDEDIMKNIILRADGRYMGRKQINGRRVTVYAHTLKQCIEKLKKASKDAIKNPQVKKVTYKLYEWLDNWYDTYKAPFLKFKSAQNIENIIREIKANFENKNISDITTNEIQKFLNQYAISRKKEFIELYFNAALQKAEDLNYLDKNPFKAVVKANRLKNTRKPFTLNEQKLILNAIKGTEIEPVIYFYACTGIRKNELATFDIEKDIDEEQNTIKILSEKKRNNRENYRLIDVTPSLISLIKKNKDKFKYKTDWVYRQFKIVLDGLGIKGGLHSLRHTFATNQFYLGTPAKQIQEWLGHETVELTQNIYTHIDRTTTKNDITKLYNNLLFRF